MSRLIRFATLPVSPWKNGGGTTREYWRLDDKTGEMLCRISLAEIAGDQAFSSFTATDRVIMQLDGPQMDLQLGAHRQPLERHKPFAFAGEAEVHCHLRAKGVVHDLNLMSRRGAVKATMRVETIGAAGAHFYNDGNLMMALFALQPCDIIAKQSHHLSLHDLLLLEDGEHAHSARRATLAVLTAMRLPS